MSRNDHRLQILAAQTGPGALNAIDFVEVRDRDETVTSLRQRTLYIFCLREVSTAITAANVVLDRGERVDRLPVLWAARADAAAPATETAAHWAALQDAVSTTDRDRVLVVRLAERGDFSVYRLRLVADADSGLPVAGFDPVLFEIEVDIKVECDTDFDCESDAATSPRAAGAVLDYLAKDFVGFRRVMLERMAQSLPDWTESSPADVGVMLIEALAAVADDLSYRQDAIATEAYLGTARSRISLRRHARLVDYRIHEGANARVWVRLQTNAVSATVPAGSRLYTRVAGASVSVAPDSDEERAVALRSAVGYETVETTTIHRALTSMPLHAWGAHGLSLPPGATSATLRVDDAHLRVGDVLVLVGADTVGRARTAAVRVTKLTRAEDPIGGLFDTPPTPGAVPVTEIEWDATDALPFALRVTTVDGKSLAQAWGNIVLADHGITVPDEELPALVPDRRYRPRLARSPLTRSQRRARALFELAVTPALSAALASRTYDARWAAVLAQHGIVAPTAEIRGAVRLWSIASDRVSVRVVLARPDTYEVYALAPGANTPATAALAVPTIGLRDANAPAGESLWEPRDDLLASDSDDRNFVVETEHDGTAQLRFSNDGFGRVPNSTARFVATYRVGNGRTGEIGVDALQHIAIAGGVVTAVGNPLPSFGSADPESRDEILRDAPVAFLSQERAVTNDDYAEIAGRFAPLQRATARSSWTGSWPSIFVSVDRLEGAAVDATFARSIELGLEPFRMAGVDLDVVDATPVPLELAISACAGAGHNPADVRRELLDELGSGVLADGRRGLFHPDNFSFGESVYLSSIVAAARRVPGVERVDVTVLRRLGRPETSALDSATLTIGPFEVAQLANLPNFPDRGVLTVRVDGAR